MINNNVVDNRLSSLDLKSAAVVRLLNIWVIANPNANVLDEDIRRRHL